MKIKDKKRNSLYVRIGLLTAVFALTFVTSAYAVSPEAPPGGLTFGAAFNKVISWMLYIIPGFAGVASTYMWYSGMFGVEDRTKRAETKDNITKLVKYCAYAWIADAVVKAILLALGITAGGTTTP